MAEVTRESLCDDLQAIMSEAMAAGDYTAAVAAVEWIGKFYGLYSEQRHLTYGLASAESAINCLAGGDADLADSLRRVVEAHKQRGELHLIQ